jgi:hypothetical protein
LPTKVTYFWLGLIAKAEIGETRRLFGGAAGGVNERQVRFQQLIATGDRHFRVVPRRETHDCFLQPIRVHVVGGGIDEIAAERDGPRDALHAAAIDAIREAKPGHIAAIGFVAAEAIAGEQPG